MLVRYNAVTSKYKTGVSALPKYFTKGRPSGGERHSQHTQTLNRLEAKIKDLYYNLESELKRVPSHAELRQAFEGKVKPTGFYDFIERFIVDSEKRINPTTNKPITKDALFRYRRTLKALREFEYVSKYPLGWDAITVTFYQKFVSFLTNDKQYMPGTIGRHISDVKVFCDAALIAGLHNTVQYRSTKFRAPRSGNEEVFLNPDELLAWYKVDLSEEPPLDKTRDLFLVACWTAVRYGNYDTLTDPDRYRNGHLELESIKTEQRQFIPLHWMVTAILKKHNGKLPKPWKNPVMNRHLKEIGERVRCMRVKVPHNYTKGGVRHNEMTEKWERVSTHTARRSFATNWIMMGLPKKVVMDVGGWKSESAFDRYMCMTQEQSAGLMKVKLDAMG